MKMFLGLLGILCFSSLLAEGYRLPKDYTPVSYVVDLTVKEETFNGLNNTFEGTVAIQIAKAQESNATELKLHASYKYITIKTVSIDDQAIDNSQYSVDNITEILTIRNVSANMVQLKIDFEGVHGDDMCGFYLSNYQDDAATKYLVTTQFQPTHGRRAFPMFDEPEFKATFEISITHPAAYQALSNTEGNRTDVDETTSKTQFAKTVVMSSYLIAFVVSEFSCQQSTNSQSVPHQICSNDKLKEWRELALNDGPLILEQLNEYTDFNYNRSFNKLDQIGIPDFSAGAMENWGLVTYREVLILWNKAESTNRQMQRISTVISHELAHMWFGNLVTTRWWSTTFLNEGFATFFETFTTHEVHPSWELDKQFVLEDHQAALETDSLKSAKALQSDASSPSEVTGKFDTISYSKGGSILRMVEHMLGKEVFQTGLQKYLKDRAYNYTEPDILWTHLDAESSDLPETLNTIMENWVINSGYPLVQVNLTNDGVQLTQSRFIFGAHNESDNREWYVPISYTQSNDTDKFENTLPQTWLTPGGEAVSIQLNQGAEWIILNNQESAFYRVNYDDRLWSNISAALLKDNFDGIHDLNRAQIVNDAFALSKTGVLHYSKLFNIIEFLKNDVSYYPWYAALDGFNFLQRRIGTTSQVGRAVQSHLLGLMDSVAASVLFNQEQDENQIYTHKQVLVLTWACRMGLNSCTNLALAAFRDYKASSGVTRPSPNLRSIIYCTGLRYSNDSSDWEFLWQQFLSTTLPSEKGILITALGCTTNTTLLNNYILYSTDRNLVRSQDAASVYSAVYTSGNEVAIDVAFNFLVENHEIISSSYTSMNALGTIVRGIAERFTTQDQVARLQTLIDSLAEGSSFKQEATGALSTAISNLEWVETKREQLEQFFEDPETTPPITVPTTPIPVPTSPITVTTTPITVSTSPITVPTTPITVPTSQTSPTTSIPVTTIPGGASTAQISGVIIIFAIIGMQVLL